MPDLLSPPFADCLPVNAESAGRFCLGHAVVTRDNGCESGQLKGLLLVGSGDSEVLAELV